MELKRRYRVACDHVIIIVAPGTRPKLIFINIIVIYFFSRFTTLTAGVNESRYNMFLKYLYIVLCTHILCIMMYRGYGPNNLSGAPNAFDVNELTV